MDMRFDQFRRYAREYLKDTAFKTDLESDSSHLFHVSLESLLTASQWTRKTQNEQNEQFNLVAGFSDLFTPNAFADRFEGSYVIGMHVPLFVSINEFALFCFAQKDFFPEMGDSSQEVSPDPWDDRVPGIWLMDHTKKGGKVGNEHSRQLIPRDPARYHLASCLSFLMTRFVWLHELAHAFNGHIDYVRHKRIALRLCELPDPNHEALPHFALSKKSKSRRRADSQTLQCMEFDADKSALWGSVQIQLGQLENIESIIALQPVDRLKLTLFGCYAMTWLFEQFQDYMDTSKEVSHPEPVLRLQSALGVVRERLLGQIPELGPTNLEVLQQFDRVRARLPSLYASNRLSEMFERPSGKTGLKVYEDRRAELERELMAFEFSQNRSDQ